MANVGLDSFSYHLHLEDVDQHRDAVWFMDKTLELGLGGCSFSPRHLHGWDETLIRNIGAYCDEHNLYLELTSSAADYARLCRRLILASEVGARMLRTFIADINSEAPAEQRRVQMSFVVENLRRLGEVAQSVGVVLGIGNRGSLRTSELTEILCRVDNEFVRASFCNAEVLAFWEDPVDSAISLSSHIASLTLKDWRVWRDGASFAYEHCALGEGHAMAADVYSMARQLCPKVPITLDVPTFSDSCGFSEEDARVRRSVELIAALERDPAVTQSRPTV